ncbi:hypothetical protein [Paractinoplanes durhamensis]|nr:hypothetical protein [Actinoplanes durhamensis]
MEVLEHFDLPGDQRFAGADSQAMAKVLTKGALSRDYLTSSVPL